MFSSNEMPSPSSLFSALASIAGSTMLFQSMVNQILPKQVRDYLVSLVQYWFKAHAPTLTFVFEEGNEFIGRNQVYEAAGVYLDTLRSPETKRLNVRKSAKEKGLVIRLENGQKVTDTYDGIELQWRFVCSEPANNSPVTKRYFSHSSEKRFYELSFHNKHEDKVSNSYIPFILEKSKAISDEKRVLNMYTLSNSFEPGIRWDSINLEHPATFETLAMDQNKKTDIIEDLNRFVRRKEFYKKVGRAWKRGYLLYGPPGTGKSSLVAAIANHLKFDIYDLQLANIQRDSVLRRLLLSTANRSILLIEDIDCSVDLSDRHLGLGVKKFDQQNDKINSSGTSLTLSGLLNFIDGLWSSCGDERIIIFTTNNKEKLDPALLRPGRMDKSIYMGYCTYEAFKQLASNYLGIHGSHQLYGEIEGLIKETDVTPAQVAEEFMKFDNVDSALEGVINLLKRKKMEGDQCEGKTDENNTAEQKTEKNLLGILDKIAT